MTLQLVDSRSKKLLLQSVKYAWEKLYFVYSKTETTFKKKMEEWLKQISRSSVAPPWPMLVYVSVLPGK